MPTTWIGWVPLPLRLFLGAYLASVGFPIIFSADSHANAVHVLEGLGIPLASIVIFGVAGIALVGGLMLIVGAYVRLAALLHIFSIGSHLLFALARGGFPAPLPGHSLPIPDLPTSFILLAGMAALGVSGAGLYSIDTLRGAAPARKYKEDAALIALRIIPGIYLTVIGTPIVMTTAGRANTIRVLEGLGVPLANVVVWGVGGIAMVGGVLLILGVFLRVASLLHIFSIGSHLVMALAMGGFPQLPNNQPLPIPDIPASLTLLGCMFALLIGAAGIAKVKQATHLNLLNVLVKIKPDQEEALKKILAEINNDLDQNPYIRFGESQLTHFARFIFTYDKDNGLRLGMGATYNGLLEPYVNELIKISPGLDAVWGKCEGYSGQDNFLQFIRQHSYPSGMVFFGFPDAKVEEIRHQIALRERIEEFIGDDPQDMEKVLEALERIAAKPTYFKVLWEQITALQVQAVTWIRNIFIPLVQAGARWLGAIDLNPQYSRTTTTYYGDPARLERELNNIAALDRTEGVYVQSTMGLFADIKPERLWLLRLLFAISPPILTYGWLQGNFAGVYSLHSFRFAIIDGGKRLWFMSNYNGAAENYFSDFIDKLNWGINSAYTNCFDYPEGGMTQTEAFAYWIRTRQFPVQVYYSAYPRESVFKILKDREISNMLGANFDRSAAERLLALL